MVTLLGVPSIPLYIVVVRTRCSTFSFFTHEIYPEYFLFFSIGNQ